MPKHVKKTKKRVVKKIGKKKVKKKKKTKKKTIEQLIKEGEEIRRRAVSQGEPIPEANASHWHTKVYNLLDEKFDLDWLNLKFIKNGCSFMTFSIILYFPFAYHCQCQMS